VAEFSVTQLHRLFSLTCSVKVNIRASTAVIWGLLTDAQRYRRWNSTITGIEGEIREGERLRLHVPGTERTFTPFSGIVPNERMTWTGGIALLFKGVRSFTLMARSDRTTDFEMVERFAGLVLPFARRSMPDFRPVFTSFANDLKAAAERPST
jgi:hypothetical protein